MKILVDADVLVGSFNKKDSHNPTAVSLLKSHHQMGDEFYVLNLVLQEVGTVLSHRVGMSAVRDFKEKLPLLSLSEIYLDQNLESLAWKIFLSQTKKGCSFVDCANLVTIEYYKFDGILTFDKFYPSTLRLK